MNALERADVSLDSSYERPAIMRNGEDVSAFNPDWAERREGRVYFVRPQDEDEAGRRFTLSEAAVSQSDDPYSQLRREVQYRFQQVRAVQQEYRNRIESLRSEAASEGFAINEASERDFWAFLRRKPVMRKRLLALLDNGNLRAVWKGEHGTHIGIEFLGGRRVQYVIFKRRRPGGDVSRVAGSDTIEGVRAQIHAFNLEPLLYT